jgi:Kef-type K+ transport system membrane component KefB
MTPQMIFSLWVLGVLAGTLILVVVCYTWIVVRGFQRSANDTKALDILTSRDGGLEFATVAIVLPAAFMLRANDWISADAAMTLISGVLGYVLGQYGSGKSKKNNSFGHLPQSN